MPAIGKHFRPKKSYYIVSYALVHFTFRISLSLRLSLRPKFGLRPKISQKVKSFFVWTQRFAERFAKTKLRTDRLILHVQDRLR